MEKRQLVAESLDQLNEWKKKDDDQPKAAYIPAAKAKIEKEKATKVKSDIQEKIDALEKQKKEAMDAPRKTLAQKKAHAEDIQKKIDAWKAKKEDK